VGRWLALTDEHMSHRPCQRPGTKGVAVAQTFDNSDAPVTRATICDPEQMAGIMARTVGS